MATWLIIYLGITSILTFMYSLLCALLFASGITREDLSLFPIDIRDADGLFLGVDGIWCYVISIIGFLLMPIPWIICAIGFCIDRIISNRW